MILACLSVTLLVTTPTAIALSTWIGVGCCGRTISIRIWINYSHLRAVMNKEANSASAAEKITNLMIYDIVRTVPLKVGTHTFS